MIQMNEAKREIYIYIYYIKKAEIRNHKYIRNHHNWEKQQIQQQLQL